jgi:YbbR domain-containing protein
MISSNTFLKIASVIIAILLWAYVMGEVNPETTEKISGISVNFTNTEELAENGLAVVYEDNIEVSAVIVGKRSEVNEAKNNGLTATIDVSNCTKGSNTEEIKLQLPDGIKMESISDETATFTVEERVQEEKEVQIEFTGDNTSSETVPWATDITPSTVVVSGAKTNVEAVDHLKGTLNSDVAEEDPRNATVSIIPVTSDDEEVTGVDLELSKVRAQVQQMTVKNVGVKVEAKNLSDSYSVDSLDAINVDIVGTADDIESIDSITGSIDLKDAVIGLNEIQVKLNLPSGIYLYKDDNDLSMKVKVKASN